MQGRNPATWLGASVNIAILRLSESSSALSRVLISSSEPSLGALVSGRAPQFCRTLGWAQPSPARLNLADTICISRRFFSRRSETPIRNSQSLQSSFGSTEEYGNNEFPSKAFSLQLFPGGRWIWFAISPHNPLPLGPPGYRHSSVWFESSLLPAGKAGGAANGKHPWRLREARGGKESERERKREPEEERDDGEEAELEPPLPPRDTLNECRSAVSASVRSVEWRRWTEWASAGQDCNSVGAPC